MSSRPSTTDAAVLGGVAALPHTNRFTFVDAECPICGGRDAAPRHCIRRFEQGDLTFVTCRQCGTVYQDPCPDEQSMRDFYMSQNFFQADKGSRLVGYIDYDAEEETRRRNAAFRLKEIERHFPAGRRLQILKVACGYGTFVKQARDAGHDATGLDASEAMVAGARARYGIELIHSPLLDHDFGDTRFDVVILYGALGNLRDVPAVGSRIHQLLKPGGLYFSNFTEPDSIIERIQGAGFWLYRPPVLGLWPARAFVALHERLGMRLVATMPDVQWASLGKLAGHVQAGWLSGLLRRAGVANTHIKLRVPGSVKIVLRARD